MKRKQTLTYLIPTTKYFYEEKKISRTEYCRENYTKHNSKKKKKRKSLWIFKYLELYMII